MFLIFESGMHTRLATCYLVNSELNILASWLLIEIPTDVSVGCNVLVSSSNPELPHVDICNVIHHI